MPLSLTLVAIFFGLNIAHNEGWIEPPFKADPLKIQCIDGDRYHVPCPPGQEKK